MPLKEIVMWKGREILTNVVQFGAVLRFAIGLLEVSTVRSMQNRFGKLAQMIGKSPTILCAGS